MSTCREIDYTQYLITCRVWLVYEECFSFLVRSDLQGRFWLPSEINILVTGIQSTAVSIDTSGASNKPPESVLRNSWTGEGLSLVDPTLPSAGVPVYLAMYFSEPLESSLRSFNIFFGGKQVGRGPVVPLFGKATQVVVRDVVASSSTLLTLWSTSSALLPPMINAAELYVISKGTSESTGGNETGSGSGSGSGGSGGGGSGSSGSGSGLFSWNAFLMNYSIFRRITKTNKLLVYLDYIITFEV